MKDKKQQNFPALNEIPAQSEGDYFYAQEEESLDSEIYKFGNTQSHEAKRSDQETLNIIQETEMAQFSLDENIDFLSHKGHRERLKTRFIQTEGVGFSDAEFLELFLFRSIPRRDTKPLAKELVARFGSFAEVICAPKHRLKEVKGVGDAVVMDFRLLKAGFERMAREGLRDRPLLNSWSKLIEYCRTTMGYSEIEEFRILFLDRKNHLIADEVQQRGTIDHTPVYPREVIKRSLELSAAAIILIHNHPSGDPTPSPADIHMTANIVDIATPMGIQVHDHIIITRESHTSFKGLKLI